MDVVISQERTGAHAISKYQFKILSGLAGSSIHDAVAELSHHHTPEVSHNRRKEDHASSSKDELVESLLKKADDMSSNVIKMQMRLESIQEEHAAAMDAAKKASYEEGFTAGVAQEQSNDAGRKEQSRDQLAISVKTLNDQAAQFAKALESIQKELTFTALEIAKEVIGVETQENSARIAAKLSADLMEELAEASKITLRVNPADHGQISEKVGSLSHVEVLSDRAINPGGVVAISDVGNVDSQIKKRYERLKRSLLLES